MQHRPWPLGLPSQRPLQHTKPKSNDVGKLMGILNGDLAHDQPSVVAALLGRAPTSYESYVRDAARAWSSERAA